MIFFLETIAKKLRFYIILSKIYCRMHYIFLEIWLFALDNINYIFSCHQVDNKMQFGI